MQFRKQGKRIQVFAYRGYDREKRRAKVEFMGSLGYLDYKQSDGLIDKLTDDEKSELQSYIKTSRQSDENNSRLSSLKYAYYSIERWSDSLSDDSIASQYPEECVQQTFAALDRFTRAMRKRGFVRRSTTPTAEAEPGSAPLLDVIDAGGEAERS